MTRSGGRVRMAWSANLPSDASETSNPSGSRIERRMSRRSASSSAISTRVGIASHGREADVERAPFSFLRLHPDAALVGLDDALDQCQPQTGAADLLVDGVLRAVKFLEQLGQVLRSDAAAGVAHSRPYLLAVPGASDRDVAAGGRVFDGVGQQVHEHPLEVLGIADELLHAVPIDGKLDFLRFELRLHHFLP